MTEQEEDPSWINRYGSHLLGQSMKPIHPTNPYTGVVKSSYVVLEASCKGLMLLVRFMNGSGIFGMTLSWIAPLLSTANVAPVVGLVTMMMMKEKRRLATTLYIREGEHLVCMVVQRDAWRRAESDVVLPILDPVAGEENAFESHSTHEESRIEEGKYEYDAAKVCGECDDLGWERRELRLVRLN